MDKNSDTLKKLKHIWIFSDGILGHEIQSKALADQLANKMTLYHCQIRQPWLSLTPRILPRFARNILWKSQKPNLNRLNKPDAIITCGRRMAAVGKYYNRQINKFKSCKHIQILNPKDNPKNYDVLVIPEHDEITAKNIITTKGSLHDINQENLIKTKASCTCLLSNYKKRIVTVFLGNPTIEFFQDLDLLANNLIKYFSEYDVYICGSRRTKQLSYAKITHTFNHAKSIWLQESDGENPYKCLLACSEILVVTADSINMVSEACATDKTVIAIAQDYISPKHKKFIQSLDERLSIFENIKPNNQPLTTLKDVAQKMLHYFF